MHEQVTLLGPHATPGETPRVSALPLSLWLGEVACAEAWTEDRAREWWTAHRST
jgi:hypothetical protein